MCLYSRLVQNPKYKPNKKNGWQMPPVLDDRVLTVPISCGNCIECRKAKAREWQLRMLEEIKTNDQGKFITLTFNTESLKELNIKATSNVWQEINKISNKMLDDTPQNRDYNLPYIKQINKLKLKTSGYKLDNEIATLATRYFLENWRKEYKKSLRHWLITELGHEGTEHIHIHGIVWTKQSFADIRRKWTYGYIWPREYNENKSYCNAKTVNYIIKYITKVDFQHKYYKSVILCSPGIGANYTKSPQALRNKFNAENTIETYKTSSGYNMAMPIYWRNKLYTDEQKEKLWLYKLDKQIRYIRGEKIDLTKTSIETYYKLLEYYQKQNDQLGYGNNKINWNRRKYEEERRKLIHATRLQI